MAGKPATDLDGVGKSAVYRRVPDKATLVAAVIAGQLPPLALEGEHDEASG